MSELVLTLVEQQRSVVDSINVVLTTYYNHNSRTGSALEQPIDHALLGPDGEIACSDPNGLNDLITCFGQSLAGLIADVYPTFDGKGPVFTHVLNPEPQVISIPPTQDTQDSQRVPGSAQASTIAKRVCAANGSTWGLCELNPHVDQ